MSAVAKEAFVRWVKDVEPALYNIARMRLIKGGLRVTLMNLFDAIYYGYDVNQKLLALPPQQTAVIKAQAVRAIEGNMPVLSVAYKTHYPPPVGHYISGDREVAFATANPYSTRPSAQASPSLPGNVTGGQSLLPFVLLGLGGFLFMRMRRRRR